MDWRSVYAKKLMTPEEAVATVQSGEKIHFGLFQSTPSSLLRALFARKDELEGVRIHHSVSPFLWAQPGTEKAFRTQSSFVTAADRDATAAGLVDYLPVGYYNSGMLPPGFDEYDTFMVRVSPPDRHGYCSFGAALWFGRSMAEHSRRVVAEVDESAIRTGGDNYLHVDQIEILVEKTGDDLPIPVPARTEEDIAITEVIGTLVASELVQDGDTLQIGFGTVSAAIGAYLGDKHDLGIQTELIPGGIPTLVEAGVINGKYKTVHPNKVVGAAFAALSPEEMALVDGNPAYELYDFTHTDDLALLLQEPRFVAINNALLVDLGGNVSAESIGPRLWSGAGGQTIFCIVASYAPAGRSIIVLPSSSLVKGERRSRIVPMLPEGSQITAQRAFVDYVVTEHGIATLHGKNLRERAGELISIAHPDFRAELRDAAKAFHLM
ncbi:MAG: hypothetical protein A2148_06115 [Chloroflexi bacterium RBG_16_68_14]|nr:MAG: hypothetical protein A2148_06115 [Chloroflexi bacterium RBG_16_68_14]